MKHLITVHITILALFCATTFAHAQGDYNEDEFLFQYEKTYTQRIAPVYKALGAGNANAPGWWHSLNENLPHSWRLDDGSHRSDSRYRDQMDFIAFGYFKGDPTVGDSTILNLDDESRTISREYPTESVGIDEKITDTVQLTTEISETYTEQSSFSVTKGLSAKVTAGFEAGTAGVKATGSVEIDGTYEQTSTHAFGRDETTTTSKTVTQSIETDVSIPANANTILLTIDIGKKQITTPVHENGYLDYSGRLTLYRWAGRTSSEHWLSGSAALNTSGPDTVLFNNVEHLLQILQGQRLREYPNMAGFQKWACASSNQQDWHAAGSCNFIKWLTDPANRKVNLTRQHTRIAEQAGTVTVQYLDTAGNPIAAAS